MTSPLFEFHIELKDFELEQTEKINQWLSQISLKENKEVKKVNYIFCSDDYLLELNKQYLNHDYFTDILSFPLKTDPIEGDIFISIDRVKENAQNYGFPFQQEFLRVMAHGLLHFMGYDDHEEQDIKIMREKEELYISLFTL